MKILGIHDGHNASASLMVDGKVILALGEERLSRNKHQYGFPQRSINKILNICNLSTKEIDKVAMSTKTLPPRYFLTQRNSNFSVSDYWKEQNEYWYPLLIKGEKTKYTEIFKKYINYETFPYDLKLIKNEDDDEGMWRARKKHLCEVLNFDSNNLDVFDHHKSHAAYGYCTSSLYKKKPLLIFTIDGGGDNTNATISICSENGEITEISRSSNANIGRIYRSITLLLGMRPSDHEFKVMGLAAYNTQGYSQEAYKVFKNTLKVDGLQFDYHTPLKDHFFYFKDRLEGQRFDSIAFALQKITEELLCEWIKNAVNKTSIKDIVISGGVAQNIKANQQILSMNEVNSLYIPPGPGDESISIGAAYLSTLKNASKEKVSIKIPKFDPYCGTSYSDNEIELYLKTLDKDKWSFKYSNNKEIALLLSKGKVIARFSNGKMEFGARALGNRSIIADPSSADVIHYLNKLVKMRDFWMPFAPSILEERLCDYLIDKKKNISKYMAISFNSTEIANKHLPAGLHPFDKTSRAQIVYKKDNPDYHSLIKEFENLTGIGALLNTSFNIHGEAIVESPKDAIQTLQNSGLKYLYIGSYLVTKTIEGN